jgi:hypothetical protein
MKAKTLLLAVTTTAFALGAQAQESGSTTFGIRAGVNFQNITGKTYDNKDVNNKLKTGFNVGVNAEIPVAPDFYVQPGVLFTTKGAKDKDDDDIKVKLSYIEVPINFLYKPELGDGKLLLGIGPYVAFGIGGKVSNANGNDKDVKFQSKISQAEMVQATTDNLQTGYPLPFYKRLDVGGNLLFGYELSSKISAQLNAQLGLVKINSEFEGGTNDNTKLKNTGFGVSLGYRF